MQKQQNIESVIAYAYSELENESKVSDEPVDKDWILRFFNSIEDISNEKMQELWGKILAGEIKQPNTYSFRTLDRLKNISQSEAHLFQKIAELVVSTKNDLYFVFSDNETLNKYNCFYGEILKLDECGLMNAKQVGLYLETAKDKTDCIYNKKIIGLFTTERKESQKVNIGAYVLTEAGAQLYKTITVESNFQYMIDNLLNIKNKVQNCKISAYEIKCIDENRIEYNDNANLLQDS